MEVKTPKEQRLERIEAIAKRFRIPMSEVMSDRRYRQVVRARKAICLMLRDEGLTTPQIGSYINRDHTSVCNLLGTTAAAKRRAIKEKSNAQSKLRNRTAG